MKTMLLIAVAGLTGLAATQPVAAQYYGWRYYPPYYGVPYGYYPAPYYPPAAYAEPPRPLYRPHRIRRIQPVLRAKRRRVVHRPLVNPLLGPLPGAASTRRY